MLADARRACLPWRQAVSGRPCDEHQAGRVRSWRAPRQPACVVSQRRVTDRILAVAVAVVSVATGPGLLVLRAWHKGSLHDLVYYTWTYNKTVHLGFSDQRDPGRFLLTALDHPVAVVAIVLAIGAWLSTRKEQALADGVFGLKLRMDWVAVNFVCSRRCAPRAASLSSLSRSGVAALRRPLR